MNVVVLLVVATAIVLSARALAWALRCQGVACHTRAVARATSRTLREIDEIERQTIEAMVDVASRTIRR